MTKRPNSSYHLRWGNNELGAWPSNSEVQRENVCWTSYIHCAFGAVKDTEENTFCASGSELYNRSNFLKNKMHQVERLFHQKVMPRLFCLFALKGMRTSLQMEWSEDQLEKIYTCLKYLIYLITKTPQNILLKTFQGEKHLLFFFILLYIQLDFPLEGHMEDNYVRKCDCKAKKLVYTSRWNGSFRTTFKSIFNGLHFSAMLLLWDW